MASEADLIVIVSELVSVKYILPTSVAPTFSFLLAVNEVIILPATDVCLNTGAELAVTSIKIEVVAVAPKVSVT